MDQLSAYEEDVYAWALHQAQVLRGLASAGLPLPNDLDLEHVAEEIEDMGNELRFQVESLVEQALVHLIKARALPEDPSVRHWMTEIRAFLRTAAKRWRPSMRRAVDVEKLWADALYQASGDLAEFGHPLPPLPETMPFVIDELVSGRTDPRDLLARLSAAAPL